jgi:hypothetical protein
MIETFSQLVGLVCVSGGMAFISLFTAAFLRTRFVEQLARLAADFFGGE